MKAPEEKKGKKEKKTRKTHAELDADKEAEADKKIADRKIEDEKKRKDEIIDSTDKLVKKGQVCADSEFFLYHSCRIFTIPTTLISIL